MDVMWCHVTINNTLLLISVDSSSCSSVVVSLTSYQPVTLRFQSTPWSGGILWSESWQHLRESFQYIQNAHLQREEGEFGVE